MSNYATKTDFKNATGVDTSSFAKKTDLVNMKSDVDKLEIDQLKNVPSALSSLKTTVNQLDSEKLKSVPSKTNQRDIDKLKNIRSDLSSLKSKIDQLDIEKNIFFFRRI